LQNEEAEAQQKLRPQPEASDYMLEDEEDLNATNVLEQMVKMANLGD